MYEGELKALSRALGIVKIGFADLSGYEDEFGITGPLLERYPRAISMGVVMPDEVLASIGPDGPSPAYARWYRQANELLDRAAVEIASFCASKGHRALPVPASRIVDWERQLGVISHKAVAVLAGLGWMGKSLLVVTPDKGPRVRFATVLTDMPLETGEPMRSRCGPCRACVEACPAKAIRDVAFDLRPEGRDAVFDYGACLQKLVEFSTMPGVGELICGICIRACPYCQGPRP
ncbi:epoxyqueuosine reductase [Candidatus Bathyarchaeota archaeon]|nr:MAG: epoxyqueuosine reductase [Candidatus Bathyarchaeota archaeon]